MLTLMAKNWWLMVLRGVCAILFGVIAWIWPGVTIGALVLLWGLYAFADGVLAFAAAVTGRTETPWWLLIIEAIVGVAAAAAAFLYPGMTAIVLLYV
ncbi:MAG TPA: DUF308 domain-containing protein, partial [Vicinamibacterales bacterium]